MWFDPDAVQFIVDAVPEWSILLVFLFSYLGSIYVIGSGVILACLVDRSKIPLFPAAIIGAYGLFVGLKPLFGIPRPPVSPPMTAEALPAIGIPLYERAISFSTGSFPSGHAVAATVFWGFLAFESSVSTVRRRLMVCVGLVFLICLSRVALGIHYPGDIVGGVMLGGLVLGVGLIVRKRVRNPYWVLVIVGGFPAGSGLFTGRPADATLLISALLVTGIATKVFHRRSVQRKHEQVSTRAD